MGQQLKSKRTESANYYGACLAGRIKEAEDQRHKLVGLIALLQEELEHYGRMAGRFEVNSGLSVQALGIRIDQLIGDPADD